MPTPLPQQTRSFLLRRFQEAGLRPKTKYGQNFLIDLNLLRLLADSAQVEPCDVVLEVGSGTGGLTALLSERAGAVIAVEVDSQLAQLAREELAGRPNVRLLVQDALANKNRLQPAVLAAVDEALARVPGARFKLAANLPYNVATPIIGNLLALPAPPATMTITIQKEMADRLVAAPGNKDFGALTAWVQCQCRVEIVRVMPPTVFWPRPQVDSAIVQLTLDPERRAQVGDLAAFHQFTRLIFCHRRKYLRGELLAAYKHQLGKPEIDAVLAECGHTGTERAEQLSVDQLLALSLAVRRRLPTE